MTTRRSMIATAAGYLAAVCLWALLITAELALTRGYFDARFFRYFATKPYGYVGSLFNDLSLLVFETDHGGQFFIITGHLWGSVGAVVTYMMARRRFAPTTTAGWLCGIGCVALLLASMRGLHAELYESGYRNHFRLAFTDPIAFGWLLAGALTFLLGIALVWRGSCPPRESARSRTEAPQGVGTPVNPAGTSGAL